MHSRVWSTEEAKPAGTDNISSGDDDIRNHMVDIRERMVLDHIWASSTATDGYHSTIHLQGRGDNPTALASYMLLFSKTGAAGAVELYVVGSGTQVTQLTSSGYVKESFISGDWILSSSTGTHTGWTNVSATYSNKFIRINATPLTTGGSDTHTTPAHTLTEDEIPSHTHPNVSGGGWGTPVTNLGGSAAVWGTNVPTGSTGGGGGHTHTAADNVPAYVQIVIFQKD